MEKNIDIYTKPCFPVAMERHVQIEIDVLRVPDQEFQRAREEINARTLLEGAISVYNFPRNLHLYRIHLCMP